MENDRWESLPEAANRIGAEKYFLRLYVAGVTARTQEVLERIQKVCEEYLKDCYELEIIDIHQQPHLAKEQQIIVTPTLIKVLPLPIRRLVGDLLETEEVLRGLNIVRKPAGTEKDAGHA
ncbi:circadian clock KaiB family protein [Telmatocola sphagniphila]|jgi:circadian clock protein KaiB|uniref:Circadian clock KaiB family protein n=1 Tax=Telmatocola sphagniphila TaxID=1123043 RepID=A0A8E6B1L3_9BACT|nr:circadian clock KaiB family protein [Telmatocola sphagniphila]QVL29941.1 circadian clock KaiB family protein [Telmatocola sphagniphila]